MLLTRLITAALVAGFTAGTITTILQLLLNQHIIMLAEIVEHANHNHNHTQTITDTITRYALTLAANIITFCGFSLILTAIINIINPQNKYSTQQGIIWGIIGFFTVTLMPTIGLPPKLPNMPIADLLHRQIWWTATAITTSTAIYTITQNKLKIWKYPIAATLIAIPHIIGAPQPENITEASQQTAQIQPQWAAIFATRSITISFIAWIILGTITTKILSKNK